MKNRKIMNPRIEIKAGEKYGHLVLTGNSIICKGNRKVECLCKCGKLKWIVYANVRKGVTKSCGCSKYIGVIKHGLYRHPLYKVWKGMRNRCLNINEPAYPMYGGNGVNICAEWLNSFVNFYEWAIENGWTKGLQLDKDKLSPNKVGNIYSPKFCCFITQKENIRHRSISIYILYKGDSKNLSVWCEELDLNYQVVYDRLNKLKWNAEKAFETPIREINKHKKDVAST